MIYCKSVRHKPAKINQRHFLSQHTVPTAKSLSLFVPKKQTLLLVSLKSICFDFSFQRTRLFIPFPFANNLTLKRGWLTHVKKAPMYMSQVKYFTITMYNIQTDNNARLLGEAISKFMFWFDQNPLGGIPLVYKKYG
jgi:hypothetical protein